MVYSKDIGGNEFGQLFRLDLNTMESTLLTDGGRSQNGGMRWKKDCSGFYFSSTKRNGGDRDIYYMNPLKPNGTKLILELKGGGWGISDLSADGKKIIVSEYVSANESYMYLFDTETKKPMFIIQGINDARVPVTEAIQMRDKLKAQGNTVWYLEAKNEGHGFRKKENVDFQRLAVIKFMQEYLLK
ncbi:prolyl oligopeptidase family serine peptidase [Chryseobacterium sp. SNU WT5]|uniref:S9 family peptidase n=1 Tax=Chryseobacterium sp. SNU WT5 TaxID=2594269 RepID=UPI0016296E92|nr:prolyl oligopeptidase family serine peptidase [Chryseobacterium sp. SNU WT5]